MKDDWESHLLRWLAAGVIDDDAAGRIRAWEELQERPQGLQWPVVLALVFGAILLGAGVLLFVSAHWDELSPGQRMALVVTMTALFHVSGAAAAKRFETLSITLHTIGSVALGAGIALTGQIFHLSEHWPAAILLWALGAGMAWALLGHWTQAALVAMLIPYWLAGEWLFRMMSDRVSYSVPVAAGFCALSFTYLTARRSAMDGAIRKSLGWLGAIALLPSALAVVFEGNRKMPSWQEQTVAWSVVICLPLMLAFVLRGKAAVWNAGATAWVLVLAFLRASDAGVSLAIYVWCALGASVLAMWGVREGRPERVNLGIVGFGLTVLCFYFSNVMDKLGRSASLILLGLLFLGGGWLLERMRRRLIAQIATDRLEAEQA